MPWVPLPPPDDDLIYLVMVDRFEDGAPNDAAVDRSDPQAWHGGDLAGVTGRLDHLDALGVKTVWLSPVFRSQQEPFGGWGAFHGYWVVDPTTIEPRFGSMADLRDLSDALHARGMRLVLDVVYNHVGWESPLRDEHPDWFHAEEAIDDWSDPRLIVEGTVHGLPDLAQEREPVYDWMLQWSLALIEAAQPDGFRIDAVRHLPAPFLERLASDLQAAAPGLELIGELYEGDPAKVGAAWADLDVDRLFDFPLHFALVEVLCGGAPAGRLASLVSADVHYADPLAMVTFLDNHDRPRILSSCDDDEGRVSEALELLFALRGTPALMWGTEAPLAGTEEPENRADMRFEELGLAQRIADLAAWRAGSDAALHGDTRVIELEDRRLVIERRTATQVLTITVQDGEVTTELSDPVPSAPTTAEPAWVTLSPVGELSSGERLVVVGSHEALGAWSVEAAPTGPTRFQVPAGSVLAYKLVRVAHDGTVTWEDGDDRYLLVPAAGAARVVRWGER